MKGLERSLRRGPATRQEIIKASLTITALSVAVADGIPGFGTAVLSDFPEGNILFLGATSYLQFSTTDVDVIATFDGDYSVGTTPTADNALAGTEVDIIPSTAMGAATAGVSPVIRGASAVNGVIFDNTDGSLELNLNVLIDDASISGAATFIVNGVLHLAYIVLGDD